MVTVYKRGGTHRIRFTWHGREVCRSNSMSSKGVAQQYYAVFGYPNVYVPPGETKSFAFQVGLIQQGNLKWEVKDLSCRVLTVHGSWSIARCLNL
jgi:hypothetical protein